MKVETTSGEDRLIEQFFRPLAKHPGAFGLTDDAAVITAPEGASVVLKIDAIVEGVHFFSDDSAELVARKALRVNLSDLAAKGAKPVGFLLALALPSPIREDWLEAFSRGLGADADAYNCPLLGGDTDYTPGPVTISIAAFGTLPEGSMVHRCGAKVDEAIVVTGTIGDAALGLMLRKEPEAANRWRLANDQRDYLLGRYLLPQPRNALAEVLRTHASAAMDVSDGLVGDLTKLCKTSAIRVEIDVAGIPLSDAAKAALNAEPGLVATLLTGGDDYEIVCTIPPKRLASFSAAAKVTGVPVTVIGRAMAGKGASFVGSDGKPMTFARPSFSHF